MKWTIILLTLSLSVACSAGKDLGDTGTTAGDGGGTTSDGGGTTGDGGGTTTGDGGGTTTGDGGGTGGVDLQSGNWDYSQGEVTLDSCDLITQGVVLQEDGLFGLANHGDGTFTITPNDGTDPFDCVLSGSDFLCDQRWVSELDLSTYGMSGLITVLATTQGSASSGTSMAGSQDAVANCEGTDCGTVEVAFGVSFPCSLSVTFTAVAN